jgi:hypothetical protein
MFSSSTLRAVYRRQLCLLQWCPNHVIVQLKPDGTRLRTVGEVKGKHASAVGSQQSCTVPQNTVYPALLPRMRTPRLQQSTELTPPRQFKWTRPFR